MKKRSFGEWALDAEKLIDEAFDIHEMQWGDLFYWIWGHVMEHRQDAREEYVDGTNPIFQYTHKEDIK